MQKKEGIYLEKNFYAEGSNNEGVVFHFYTLNFYQIFLFFQFG